jgi:ribonucleoside-diphosphate reductase alpha chain
MDYFHGETLPTSVFLDKYALRTADGQLLENEPGQMHRRIARELARIEKTKFKRPYTEDFIFSLLEDFGHIIPQGSPMFGIGNPQYITLSNCYVVEPPLDSYGGVHLTDEQMTQICKRRGGVGTDVSHIRPYEMPTTNAARRATGVVPFCERFSNSIREVAQKGRRGALMLTISVHHPQVVDFATMKMDAKKVTGANVSVRLSDEFLTAVELGQTYEQRWPVEGKAEVSRRVNAREVWQKLIHCAWQRAEPGLIFWDMVLRESPADCYASKGFATVSTNPCSELPLCVLDSCRLLLLNLFAFVHRPFTSEAAFDWGKFYAYSKVAQRLMDDIVDLEIEAIYRILAKVSADPQPHHVKRRELELWEQVLQKCKEGRRTGTGLTAMGDAIAALGVAYGSDESIAFVERVYRTLKFACYESSVDMAEELGPFPVWEHALEQDCPFLVRLKDETVELDSHLKISGASLYERMTRHGRRNIALLTTAPAGSVSILAGPRPYFGTTSGIEPLFTDAPYTRRKKIVQGMPDARVDFVDELGDKWTHFEVFHPKLKMWLDVTGESDWTKSPYHGCTANDLDWKRRVMLQAAAQRHVDHAISSTVNLPGDVTVERVAEVYETAWKAGCKGITVYRDGCRDGVLVKEPKAGFQKHDAPKRPDELPCELFHQKVQGRPFVVVVGLFHGEPYEVFAFTNYERSVSRATTAGCIHKARRGCYHLRNEQGDPLLQDSLTSLLSDTEEALTRMVSTSLRHGADLSFVVQQLEKTKGGLQSFAKAVARALKKFIKNGTEVKGESCESCQEEALVRQEGCVTCRSCGWSKCA